MKSAYAMLGLPLGASAQEIENAFERACARFPPERLELEPGAVRRLEEIKDAYAALQSPDVKEAHERWLARRALELPSTTVTPASAEAARAGSNLRLFLLIVGAAVVAATYIGYKTTDARREEAALARQMQVRHEREQQEERAQAEREAIEAAAAASQARARAEAMDSRFAAEGRAAGERATAERIRQDAAAHAEQRRIENERIAEERQRVSESRARTEADKQRVRQLCIQLYGRPDC